MLRYAQHDMDVVTASSRLPAPPSRRLRVLVTGATGYIASLLLPAFRERYDLQLVDVRMSDLVTDVDVLNLLEDDDDRLKSHFQGVDAVVHLGYYRPSNSPVSGQGKGYMDERPNVDMAERVYRASLDAGVNRVVVASSNHAADWYEQIIHLGKVEMIGPGDLPKSDNYYGWAKIAYEALGFTYACGAFGHRLGVVQLRVGAPREIDASKFEDRPATYKREIGAYISQRDLQQLFIRSIETEHIEDEWGVPFQVFYGISNNARAFWSIANARRVIGYDPQDDSEIRFAADVQRLLISRGQTGRLGSR
jgi:NAD+ dependent glucose-6-phosphate dehydrogenase